MAAAVRKVVDRLVQADVGARDVVKPYRRTLPVKALSWYSELGDQPQMLAISGGLVAAGLIRGDRRMARAGVRMIAAHLLATAAKNFIKHRVNRTRPRNAAQGEGPRPKPGRSEAKAKTSFPSGHSAGAIAVACAFGREYPEYRRPALGAGALIAAAQIPRFAHYPTDVLAGTAIGWISEAAVDAAWRLSPMSRR